jgi:hypothetical protein
MTVSLAMLLQSRIDPRLGAAALIDQLCKDWPDLDAAELKQATAEAAGAATADDGDGDAAITIGYKGFLIALMPIPAPIGTDDIAQLCTHSRLWPNDRPAPQDYAAHTIVTVMGSGDAEPDAAGVPRAVLLSKVLASAIALTGSIQAVYFGNANHVVLPELFRDLARELLPQPLPMAWVAVNVGERPDGVMTGHTRGMDMLGLMDIEIPATRDSAEDVYGRLSGICGYLIEHGQVINDGDTLGSTADERIKVVYAPSAFGDGRQVMRLDAEPIEAAPRSWWKKLLN